MKHQTMAHSKEPRPRAHSRAASLGLSAAGVTRSTRRAKASSMSRSAKLLLADITDSCDRIERYTAGMTAEAFQNDTKAVDAVLHNLVIIGEAA